MAQLSHKPAVLEIVGPSGAGKTTLAERLPAHLSEANVRAVHSKTEPFGHLSLKIRGAGAVLAISDILGLSRYFLHAVSYGDVSLGLAGIRRLLKSFRHALVRRVFSISLPSGSLIVQEPGWPMELLSHYLYSTRPLDDLVAIKFLKSAPAIDYLVILTADPQVSIGRMSGRGRGIPQGLRHLATNELHQCLDRGNHTSAALERAARSLDIKTLKLDVSNLDADEVARKVAGFVQQFIVSQ